MKERIHWIDITKGLFIILMVLGHIPNMSGNIRLDNTYLVKCIFFASIYGCFFMQGFFVLTGYTSNFDKEFKPFLLSNIKLLLIPWLSFSVITRLLGHIFFNQSYFDEINGEKYFFLIEDYWFIQALFFSKIAYYFIRKYIKSDFVRFVILLCMTIVGFYSISYYYNLGFENPYHVNNYLHYKDFLCMAVFLWVGDYMKRRDLIMRINKWVYLCIIIVYLVGHGFRVFGKLKGIEIPELSPVILSHGGNIVSLSQIPAYLFYVIMGCLSCFGIVKSFKQCRVLEYYGRNSLIVYCIHFFFLTCYISITSLFLIPNGIVNALLFIIIVFLLTLVSVIPVVKVFNFRPFSYLVGKF